MTKLNDSLNKPLQKQNQKVYVRGKKIGKIKKTKDSGSSRRQMTCKILYNEDEKIIITKVLEKAPISLQFSIC